MNEMSKCKVCDAFIVTERTPPPWTCGQECARVAYIADAIDRMAELVERGIRITGYPT